MNKNATNAGLWAAACLVSLVGSLGLLGISRALTRIGDAIEATQCPAPQELDDVSR